VAASRAAVVLVIEDDVLIRRAAREALEAEGYEVIEAASAAPAVEILAARSDITVVFTDVDLSNAISGAALARLLVRQAPWVSVVVTSYGDPIDIGYAFLPKPYAPRRMLEVVRGAAEAACARSAGK